MWPRSIFSSSQRPVRSSPASATKCGKPPMYLYSPGFSRLPQITSIGALLAAVCHKPKKQSRRVIVAFARALVERATDGQFDVPPPREHRVSGKVDIDMPKQHRGAVMGFEPHARHAILDREGHAHRRTCPEFPMPPAGGERIEREGLPKIHHGHDRAAIG